MSSNELQEGQVASVRLRIRMEGDWTEQVGRYDIQGDIFTASLVDTHYTGLIRLYGEDVAKGIELIRDASYHVRVDVIERALDVKHKYAVLFVTAVFDQMTPFRMITENEYLLFEPSFFRNGWFYLDTLVWNREQLAFLVDELDEICTVTIEQIISGAEFSTLPNPLAWSELLTALTDRQMEVLSLALERGYYDQPSKVSLEELGDEMDLHKSTVGEHINRASRTLAEFIVENYHSTARTNH
ncbi:helix-turn-helix domain-containing protein [Natrarchaeobius oligotrophus]|uniref:HTH bat-type domain-containing protein n=1 Tax=Natrarchaeobius chitinivorans TaxID=1679083 RepID=A0A3N6MTX6_NATCH|nr:helix-turn-helix domain-containing protein [Natrarchaeobius chitinivorans]RQH01371.1 hypothetical protein EA472_07965 [Natrarchaeobius chitinivorans]